ncbi:hypothetical protein BD779DRAFT_1679327 [Infundibulicybe gibba]|nr:hypothetical protein BD779DRAFT_1679327 [Infundibulicybe gibba]
MTAPLPRRVIVDDADPQIQYSSIGQWTSLTGGSLLDTLSNGLPFQNITHSTNTTSSLSLQFRGSQPQVFGTSMGVQYECFVDDTSIGSTADDTVIGMNNLILCDGAQFFEAKEYTLTLNVTHELDGMRFYFDYITYIPSTSDPLGSATVLVDKFDPAVVYTQGDWLPGRLLGQLDLFNGSTAPPVNIGTHSTSLGHLFLPGQNQSTSNAIYSIDKIESASFSIHASTVNLTHQVLFTSPTLDPGPHSLEVTHLGNATTPPLVLDHLVVTNNVSTPSAATSANKPSTSVLIGTIVGGIVGG